MKSSLLIAPLLFLFAFAACDSGDDEVSVTTAELVGTWKNDEDGTTRAFEFTETAGVFGYTLYFYPSGSAPAVAQRGTYEIAAGRLVTHVAEAPVDPSLVGRDFGNDVLSFSATRFVLQSDSAASGKRTFTRVDALE